MEWETASTATRGGEPLNANTDNASGVKLSDEII